MKKQFKQLTNVVAAVVITTALAMVTNAETIIVPEGVTASLPTMSSVTDEAIIGQFAFSKTPISGKTVVETEVPMNEIDGYEWKCAYIL